MKNIMLICTAGMSTSLLVTKMKKASDEKNMETNIFAIAVGDLENTLKSSEIDCVMLGPQVRYKDAFIKNILNPNNIPSEYIDSKDYGMMEGKKVLQRALEMIDENK